MTRRALLLLAGALALGGVPAQAQQVSADYRWTMPPQYREIQLRAQETQRRLLLAFADSMPERLYRDSAFPGQRDFARQLHHAANADLYIASRYIAGTDSIPFAVDTAKVFGSRAELKAFINRAYDYSIGVLRAQTDAERSAMVWYFGQKIPRWLIWDELNQHTLWTLGQAVANFRKHGMAPPGFSYY